MEVKSILKEQSSVKVVLNGGKYQLEQATIPFQIGFDKAIADKKPTHILVIDVISDPFEKNGERRDYDSYAKRTIFELEPIHYLQLNAPGIHHFIFILLINVVKDARRLFLEKEYSNYVYDIYYDSIEINKISKQLGYAEVVVDVPKELFAPEPETRFQKAIYHWVNSWYSSKPVDQCEFRGRKFWAFTLKPILWLPGFVFRLMSSFLLIVAVPILRLLCFFFGYQPLSLFPNLKELFVKFLFFYPRTKYEEVFGLCNWLGDIDGDDDDDFYPYKTIAIGKMRIHTPITLAGLACYMIMFFSYGFLVYWNWGMKNINISLGFLLLFVNGFVSIIIATTIADGTFPTIKKGDEWRYKCKDTSDGRKLRKKIEKWVASILISIGVIAFLLTQIKWVSVGKSVVKVSGDIFALLIICCGVCALFWFLYMIYKLLSPVFSKLIAKIPKTEKAKLPSVKNARENRNQKHQEWLSKSFDINKLPEKVDFKKIPEPSSFVHKFEIAFWQLKAKVCKPYARK